MTVGDSVRIPMITGSGSGLTRWGIVVSIEGAFVRVEVRYGQVWKRVNSYTIAQLDAEAEAWKIELARKRQRSKQRKHKAIDGAAPHLAVDRSDDQDV